MSQSVNGYPDFIISTPLTNLPVFQKLTEINRLNTDKCLVFLDEQEFTLVDSQFGAATDNFWFTQRTRPACCVRRARGGWTRWWTSC